MLFHELVNSLVELYILCLKPIKSLMLAVLNFLNELIRV